MNIAIIGAGISGLGAAYLLGKHHRITLYEASAYLGGHSRTVEVAMPEGNIPVDTGFIVFNHHNYPHLTGLFDYLSVPTAKSNMSFGVSIENGWLEYGTLRLAYLFAQKRNLTRPAFWRMLADILRFNRQARAFVEAHPTATIGECLKSLGLGDYFQRYYLLAMSAAIWSTSFTRILDFPAKTLVRFFENHGLLTTRDQPQWHTVQGGSREYDARMAQAITGEVLTNRAVVRVVRKTTGSSESGVAITDSAGDTRDFDAVIFACHSDQALAMIDTPSDAERAILGAIGYQANEVVLHSDSAFMPRRRAAWASWVYLSDTRHDAQTTLNMTYWMNNLQPLATTTPMLVTLNPSRAPKPLHNRHTFHHPLFDTAAIAAQARLADIQGVDRFWFCGAWCGYGFHEDGLKSAVAVAERFGIQPPWR